MRNLHFVLRAFAGAIAVTTLAACEEEMPVKRPTPTVSAPAQPTPSKQEERVALPAPMPTPIAVKPVAPPAVAATDKADDGDEPDDIVAQARAALGKGELDRALKLARLATKRSPQRSAAWNTLGRVQLKRGQRQEAIASFQEAVECNPSSSYAQNNLGLALIYDGQYDEAVGALEEATQLAPVEGYMWNNLGMAYEHLDRLEEARDAYQTAMQLAVPRAHENFARLQGVKSVRTAKADFAPTAPADDYLPHDEVATDDGGAN
jgi:Flp pilus assembly protein TadD